MLVEIVAWRRIMPRFLKVLDSCGYGLRRAGHQAVIHRHPSQSATVHLTWGLGHPEGQALLKTGKRVIGFDLGYWQRADHFRVTFDHDHPQAYVMRDTLPPERWQSAGIQLRKDADPAGHILLIGTGHKTAATYGELTGEWERRTGGGMVSSWPGRRLVFRPKKGGLNDAVPDGFELDQSPNIETALRGCALVVCRNSNVAVDAIIAGVPFTCEDGAAMAVNGLQPLSEEVRLRFLRNLAWFQWSETELRKASVWRTIFKLMDLK